MKEKILAQLKLKYSGVSLVVLGLIADKLAAKVTDEAGIEQAITDFETNSPISVQDYAATLQKEGDRRVTEALKKKGVDPKPEEPNPGEPSDPLLKAIQALTAKVDKLEQGQTVASVTEKLHKQLSDKKIPLSYIKGRAIDPERSIEEQVAEIEADYTAFKQELTNDGLAVITAPAGGAGGAGAVSEKAVEADITGWAKSNQPASTATGK